jgi:hypothetical protein
VMQGSHSWSRYLVLNLSPSTNVSVYSGQPPFIASGSQLAQLVKNQIRDSGHLGSDPCPVH